MEPDLDRLLARLDRRGRHDAVLRDFESGLAHRLARLDATLAPSRLAFSFQAAAITVAFVVGLAYGVGAPSAPPPAPTFLVDVMEP